MYAKFESKQEGHLAQTRLIQKESQKTFHMNWVLKELGDKYSGNIH